MAWTEAFAPCDAKYRNEVLANTWGALAPKRGKTYKGHIVFAVGCYDPLNPVVLSCEFRGLNDSPWFFDAMAEFISGLSLESGSVHRFEGTFKNYSFRGTTHRMTFNGKVKDGNSRTDTR